jgi:hypothetical protein
LKYKGRAPNIYRIDIGDYIGDGFTYHYWGTFKLKEEVRKIEGWHLDR